MSTPTRRQYVIVYERRDGDVMYFIRLGLGVFWECTTRASDARRFDQRAQAATMLHRTGKHHEGWRIVPAPKEN